MFQRSRPVCRLKHLHKHFAGVTTTLPHRFSLHPQQDKTTVMRGSSSSFHMFARLPAELQLKVWSEAASPGPAMHVFDLCFPSSYGLSEEDRGLRAFGTLWRYMELEDVAFLDAAGEKSELGGESYLRQIDRTAGAMTDPSMYRWRMALRRTCVDASNATALPSNADQNIVRLPHDKCVSYDNSVDVLYLRLAQDSVLPIDPPSTAPPTISAADKVVEASSIPPTARLSALINGLIDHPWSKDMTTTIQSARRIALDLTSSSDPKDEPVMHLDSAAFLACALHHNLEHLYLVVNSPKTGAKARSLQTRGPLFCEMSTSQEAGQAESKREGEVISGIGVTYREIFDFEALGWEKCHPIYELARVMDEAVASMQRDSLEPNLVFKGVRVLVEERDA